MRGFPDWPLPDLVECIEANLRVARLTNPAVVATGVALNTSKLDEAAARRACAEASERTGLPATDPHRFGADVLADALLARFPGAAATA